MKFHRLLLLMMSMALATSVAMADTDPTAPGTLEFSGNLAFTRQSFSAEATDQSWSVTNLNAALSAGRAMTKDFSLTAALLGQHHALGGEGKDGLGASLGAVYNMPRQGNLLPFASASVGAINYFSPGQSDKALLLPMMRVGFRSMIGGDRSLNVSMGYQHETNSESDVAGSSNMFDVGIGLSIFQAR